MRFQVWYIRGQQGYLSPVANSLDFRIPHQPWYLGACISWFGASRMTSFSSIFRVSVTRSFFDRLGIGLEVLVFGCQDCKVAEVEQRCLFLGAGIEKWLG